MPDEELELDDFEQLPCAVCGQPVDITHEKKQAYEFAGLLPLCLEDELKAYPERF